MSMPSIESVFPRDGLGIDDVEISLGKDELGASANCEGSSCRPSGRYLSFSSLSSFRLGEETFTPSSLPSHLEYRFVPGKTNPAVGPVQRRLSASGMASTPEQQKLTVNTDFPIRTIGSATSDECSADEREGKASMADTSWKEKMPRSPGWKFMQSKAGANYVLDHCSPGSLPAKYGPIISADSAAVDVKSMTVLEVKLAVRHRRKSFAHYDCVSALTNLSESMDVGAKGTAALSANVKSGASAARASRSNSNAEEDIGDGKSNDMLLSTPHFRNELGADSSLCGLDGCPYLEYLTFLPVSCEGIVFDAAPVGNLEEEECERQASSNVGIVRPQGGHQTKDVRPLRFSFMDHGALYYRLYFSDFEHQNYFGVDDNLGPVAISLRREAVEIPNEDGRSSSTNTSTSVRYQYRIIVRTCHREALRGCVLEESILSAGYRGRSGETLRAKDVIAFVAPELQLSALHLGQSGSKVRDQLCRLDEQGVTRSYKIGVMYCAAEQSTEEEMYNNQEGSALFNQFLETCLGSKVALKGFEGYRAQLDNKQDSTGSHSIYTKFHGNEVMFHVSTMLPFCKTNRQQLLRKRHIGNDIVTVIFQDPGAKPFTPATIRSQFQHVFIVVKAHINDDGKVQYRMAVSRASDIPLFEPILAANARFDPGEAFCNFLLTKIINAEGAAHCSAKFHNLATRTRFDYLTELANHWSTNQTLESSESLGFYSRLAKIRRRPAEKAQSGARLCALDLTTVPGAIGWHVQVINWGCGLEPSAVEALLCISARSVCIVDPDTRMVRFHVPSLKVIGWSLPSLPNTLCIYYHQGDFIVLRVSSQEEALDEVPEIMVRLSAVSNGRTAHNITLQRSQQGHLGFIIHHGGLVGEVDHDGAAWKSGLRPGARIVEMDGIPTYGRTHEEVVLCLKEADTISALIIPPNSDGTPRTSKKSIRYQRPCTNVRSLSPSSQHLASRRRRFQQEPETTKSAAPQWNSSEANEDGKHAERMRRKDRQWGAVAQVSQIISQPVAVAHIDKNNPALKGIVQKAKLALATSAGESIIDRSSGHDSTSSDLLFHCNQSVSCQDLSRPVFHSPLASRRLSFDITANPVLVDAKKSHVSQLISTGDTLEHCLKIGNGSSPVHGSLEHHSSLPEMMNSSESVA